MKQELKKFLSQREKRRIADSGCIPAAVLMPLYCKEGQYHILFTKRTSTVKTHKGEISFPGGSYERSDGSLLNTALRESAEEIGLVSGDVEVLGELDDTVTTVSNYVISPFVALIPYPYLFRLEKNETEEIIEVPIKSLLDRHSVKQQVEYKDGRPLDEYIYIYEGRRIHGATARILNHFLDIWTEVVGDTHCAMKD